MGGGSPRHPTDTREDSGFLGRRHGEHSIWPPVETASRGESVEFSFKEGLPPAGGGLASAQLTVDAAKQSNQDEMSLNLSIEDNETSVGVRISSPRARSQLQSRRQSFPGDESEHRLFRYHDMNFTRRRVEADDSRNDAIVLQDEVHDIYSRGRSDGESTQVVSPTRTPTDFKAESEGADENEQDIQGSEEICETPLQRYYPATITTLTGTSQSVHKNVFKLMEIQNDNQDLSFVEKVILSQDDMFRLSNHFVAGSAKASEGRRIIDFEGLNCEAMKVVGFFGSKYVMREVFQNTEIAKQREVWEQMQNDTLAPGLYVSVDGNVLFVFYWHQGHSLPEATRKDMSCNFIRYIFDLCDTVCVCLEDTNLKNALRATAPSYSKRQRTQRLQISLVKSSEDSVRMTEGFALKDVQVGASAFSANSTDHKQGSSITSSQEYKLSEGRSRLALLSSSTRPRKLSSTKETEEMHVKVFPEFVREKQKEYNLDLSSLSDPDFVVFLRCSELKQADMFTKLVDFHDKRKTDEKNKIYGLDQLVAGEEELLIRCLASFVGVYLKHEYPWEEILAGNSLDPRADASKLNLIPRSVSTSNPAEDASNSTLQARHAFQKTTSLNSSPARDQSHSVPPEFAEDVQRVLRELESDFYSILVGKTSQQRLVLPTSEVYIYKSLSGTYEESRGQRIVFTVENSTTFANANKFAPILYGTEVIFRPKGHDHAARSKPVILKRCNEKDFGGPLLTDEELELLSTRNIYGTQSRKIKLLPVQKNGDLQEWLDWVVRLSVPHLLKQAVLLAAIFEEIGDWSTYGFEEKVVQQILLSNSPLDILQPLLLTPSMIELAKSKWSELKDMKNEVCVQTFSQMTIPEAVKTLCADVYIDSRDSFRSKFVGVVRRYSATLLSRKIRRQCSVNYASLQATLEREKADFLASQRAELQGSRTEGRLTLTVQTCRTVGRYGMMSLMNPKYWLHSEDGQRVSISYSQQRFEKESITWRCSELAPMKDDLDKLIIDPEYLFTPSSSGGKDIIDLDPSTETLSKIVFLKAGWLLVFIIDTSDYGEKTGLMIYLCQKLGVKLSATNLIRQMKRGFDLIAFDERTRFIAFYDSSISTIKTYRFDENFRHMDWIGTDVTLSEYAIGRLIWMDFVTGKNEIVFIDESHRVRLCEVNNAAMVRSGNVHLGHNPIVKACVTSQGSCLLVLRTVNSAQQPVGSGVHTVHPEKMDGDTSENEEDVEMEESEQNEAEKWKADEQLLMVDVYKLDDRILHCSSIPLDIVVKDTSKLQFSVVSFASQMHLAIHDRDFPGMLVSKILRISSAAEVCQLQQVTRPDEVAERENHQEAAHSGPVLDYVYQVFEKYATSPPLISESREIHLRLLLEGVSETSTICHSISNSKIQPLSEKCLEYVNSSLEKLKRDKGKDFTNLQIRASAHELSRTLRIDDLLWNSDNESHLAPFADLEIRMGDWIRRLVCLVPIQIARAENNGLKPMVDGLQLSSNADYVDAISLANVLRFGLYEAVLDNWAAPIKVISSMGKQSSGKSYLLNHLSGSLLDVAGGRCTDGVWMTARHGNGCLYVLLDFEGLGSFERSEQEDMLLSILNAAISNLTIFNKKDFHLDKETEAIFERFQNGVTLVKTDSKLFRGLFYMAIKDVDSADVEDLKKEFFSKISQICSKSQDNFLTKMYGGAVEISAMPSFNRPEFHESIGDIGRTVEELEASYVSGRSFVQDLKLIIAQISTKDWSPIDSKRVALRLTLLRKHLKSAISIGCVFTDGTTGTGTPLIQFDNHAHISDEPLQVLGYVFSIGDTSLELIPFQESKVTGDIVLSLMATFKSSVPRKGEDDEKWHTSFESFISALVQRRKGRVLQWITLNTSDFSNDGDVQKLHLEAVALLAEVQQNLLLCSCKCERCFLRCLREKGHPSSHSCMGDHRCVAMCTYCLDEESILGVGACSDAAGHGGPHACREKSHTCGKGCTYASISSNCNGNCSKKSGHSGDHECNSRQHMCNQFCSLPSCKNPCVSPIDLGDHEHHFCHEKYCPVKCSISGCNRTCATQDHFHGINRGVKYHFCGSDHPCPAKCQHKGNCEVLTEVSKKTQTFKGKRATFDYELVSEQNGNRKGCCIVIPANKATHKGPHSHSTKLDAVHFCETRCPSCGYFCNRPIGHGGLHNTTHGNMRDVNFVAELEEIDILDRRYTWGESGVAEMCQMNCKAQGRGHIHLIHCPATNAGGTCRKLFDGAQHEMRKYGPDFDVAKDEMTHAAFWEYLRFEDPCNAEEKKQFALCNHECKSDEHAPTSGGATSAAAQNKSYCTESLWHQPVSKSDLAKFGTGYVTEDGHHFSCDHSKNVSTNVIFIIDRSGSMGTADARPSMTKFAHHNNRLGCVYEAILRFIRTRLASVQGDVVSVVLFDGVAQTVINLQEMKETLVDELLKHHVAGGTTYSAGLQDASKILTLASKDANLSRKSPVIIFLSDGGNTGGSDPLYEIRTMKAMEPKLQIHTIMFGNDPARKILEDMAKAGDGTFEVSLDEVQLSRRFEGLAKSLRPKVSSLI